VTVNLDRQRRRHLAARKRDPRGERCEFFVPSPWTFHTASKIGQRPLDDSLWGMDHLTGSGEGGFLPEDQPRQRVVAQRVLNGGPKEPPFHRVGANVRTADGRRVDQTARHDSGAIRGPPVRAAIRQEVSNGPAGDMTDDVQPLLDSVFVRFQVALRIIDRVERLPGLGDRRIAQLDPARMKDARGRRRAREHHGGGPPGLNPESHRRLRHHGRIDERRKKLRDKQGLSRPSESRAA